MTKSKAKTDSNTENILTIKLKDGEVRIELFPEDAPDHVKRIKALAKEGMYDGVAFHRVIDGFMAQTGDPTGTGRGGSGQNLDAEFSLENHKRGVLSMARSQDPDSADSQFFIVFDDSSFLDNQYTVWGEVSDGMDLVDKIKRGAEGSGAVDDPDMIVKMQVAADADK